MHQLTLDLGLAPRPSFDNFLPDGNIDVVQHLQLWASNPQRSPVPTLVWGEPGAGKTHLLQAVRAVVQAQGGRVGWLDPQVHALPEFDERWSVLILDDCQWYSAAQQEAAFQWFVHAQTPQQGPARWLLASADRPPADLALREDLRTRLGWGHVFQLQLLAEAERRAVLRRSADARGVFLGDDVMDYLLKRFSRDLGSLMQLLDQLDGYALRTQRAITIPLVRAMLENE